jgi:GAF domain-containing protein
MTNPNSGPITDPVQRVAALASYAIMDTPPEADFDDLSRLTTFICGTPIATVTLLDERRQWFKSKVGLDSTEGPLEHAFCRHAIEQEHVFLVPDAQEDPRFCNNPLVTGAPHIRFYAGAPLISPEGVALGTLCAIDRVPRQMSLDQRVALASLSRQVMRNLELRRTVKALSVALAEVTTARREVATLQDMLPICSWCRKVRDDANFWHHVEDYLADHSDMQFSHGVCPDCAGQMKKEMTKKIAV